MSVDKQMYDDQLLIRYLLGDVADEEAERLDELSIADDEFATRLSAIENDLVDSYVRGELSGSTLEQFKSSYLSSATRRQKVVFAQTFCGFADNSAKVSALLASGARDRVLVGAPDLSQRRSWRRYLAVPQPSLQWSFAGAALLMALMAGYLLLNNARLQNQLTHAQAERTALEQRQQQLQKQLSEVPRLPEQTHVEQSQIVSLVLAPPTRGWARIATVIVPKGTNEVNARLQLDGDDFATYQVSLRDPATDRILWRSQALKPAFSGDSKAVSLRLPANLLRSQNYVFELSGLSQAGATEFISGYPFKAVMK
jgi:hypothetical protein